MNQEIVSVSWVSFNNDPYRRERDGRFSLRDGQHEAGPTLEFLLNADSPVAGQISTHYLLVRRRRTPEIGGREFHASEVDVAKALIHEVAQQRGPSVVPLYWDTDAAPTDHQELFRFVAPTLAEIRRKHPKARIIVNLSQGTPAAQTVMLLALQARVVGDNVLAYQGIPKDKRQAGQVLQEVNWNLLADLARSADDDTVDEAWSLAKARSASLRKVAELVQRYGGVPFPVLIIGNRGSGKTQIAESLRQRYLEWRMAALRNEWQYQMNCAEFRGDPTILRSSLFGYAKGSHSTANKESKGLLQLAEGDCVFLDEIHWMDSQAQGALLLALQRNGTFRRIGGEEIIKSNFRLIAATNKSRSALRDTLAPDFLDRISELVIELPDLRECREDLEDIWKSVVRRACDELVQCDPTRALRHDTSKVSLVRDYIEQFRPHQHYIARALRSMRLDGNYRDLERLARRLLVGGLQTGRLLSIGPELVNAELETLRREELLDDERTSASPASLRDELPTISRCTSYLREVRDKGGSLSGPDLVEEWERRLLVAAQRAADSGTKAAELLGMNPRTFNAKAKGIRQDGV
ncbi:sigma 54-interacting transcriptional regulator [Burkholderia aenigmatica]|uniref:sigma 54-interacting transcriptional regulator n=1 Tax=Burkholderia aenigmatica TaxID=2015348 RepID=UPI001EFFC23C|nr:sigma 54-interacting transcriptional regulator [Burkholderia aenigmatica]UKD17104.1 sigma 54-interacting transcriptional regulator [Burkholderia aenigmatica]